MKVVVAHERASARGLLQGAVRGWGHASVVTRSCAEAWAAVQADGADLILCGWSLAAPDALDLCRQVRAREGVPYTYLLLLTPPAAKAQALLAVHAGADDYLLEPVELDELQARLATAERVLRLRHQAARRLRLRALLRDWVGRAPAHDDPLEVLGEVLAETVGLVGPPAGMGAACACGSRTARPAATARAELAAMPELPAARAEPVLAGSPLSPREREVAVLVARGLTNREIAERLTIGARTAESHVASILARLGLSTRAQVAAWAVEHGLLGGRLALAAPDRLEAV